MSQGWSLTKKKEKRNVEKSKKRICGLRFIIKAERSTLEKEERKKKEEKRRGKKGKGKNEEGFHVSMPRMFCQADSTTYRNVR